jgi:hypothetical protein
MLDDNHFAVADDEGNTIRVFALSQPGNPLFSLPLDTFLEVDPNEPECDIEGAARVGDLVYFITSHSLNKNGKTRLSRQRFFALRIVPGKNGSTPVLQPFGHSYSTLLRDLLESPVLAEFDLDAASRIAPKEKNGFNIEALCARPDGSLLIGFRNPIPRKEALLVPLLNPGGLVTNTARATLGKPILLPLDGRGIRGMAEENGAYFIIAGSYDAGSHFEIFRWNGRENPTLAQKWKTHEITPEAILTLSAPDQFFILSDDGTRRVGKKRCKDLPESQRRFRGINVTLNE